MASTVLTRTPSGAGNQKKWTYSIWFKRVRTNEESALFCVGDNPSNNMCMLRFDPDVLNFYSNDSNAGRFSTAKKFRDTNAWYHVVVAYDSANATSDDRLKFYVNGERIPTSEMTGVNAVAQNTDSKVNSTLKIHIGERPDGNNHFEGLMSHIHFCDGYAYAASDFGETDTTTGEWKIKTSPSVSYGSNGFFILKDGNSVTDQSPNSNNFAVEAGTLTKTEDCPSNNFAIFNYLYNSGGTVTYNAGSTKFSESDNQWKTTFSTLGASSGKYYAEFKCNGAWMMVGVADYNVTKSGTADRNFGSSTDITTQGYGYYNANGDLYYRGSSTSYGATYGSGDIVQVALDCDNNRVFFGKNGTWQNSADPTNASTGFSMNATDATYVFAASVQQDEIHANFGNGYFNTTAVASAGTNASGNGIFEYDVPTGFTALSTKGLNE